MQYWDVLGLGSRRPDVPDLIQFSWETERRNSLLAVRVRAATCSNICFGAYLAAMEVQWVGVEPPRLGPPHTAVGLIFSVLFGNVSLSLYVISFFYLFIYFFAPPSCYQLMCTKPSHLPFLKILFFSSPYYWITKSNAFVLSCTGVMPCLFQIRLWPSSASELQRCLLQLYLLCRCTRFCFDDRTSLLVMSVIWFTSLEICVVDLQMLFFHKS